MHYYAKVLRRWKLETTLKPVKEAHCALTLVSDGSTKIILSQLRVVIDHASCRIREINETKGAILLRDTIFSIGKSPVECYFGTCKASPKQNYFETND